MDVVLGYILRLKRYTIYLYYNKKQNKITIKCQYSK